MTQSLFLAGRPTISLSYPLLLATEKPHLTVAPVEANLPTRRLLPQATLPVEKWVVMARTQPTLMMRAKLPPKVIQG